MKILKLENINEVLINKFNKEKKDFIDTYEKEHKEDLLDMFNKFYNSINYLNKSMNIKIENHKKLFKVPGDCKIAKKAKDDFIYYCNLKGFKINEKICSSTLGESGCFIVIFL